MKPAILAGLVLACNPQVIVRGTGEPASTGTSSSSGTTGDPATSETGETPSPTTTSAPPGTSTTADATTTTSGDVSSGDPTTSGSSTVGGDLGDECPPPCDFHDPDACPNGQVCHPFLHQCMRECVDCPYECTKGENLCPPCLVEESPADGGPLR